MRLKVEEQEVIKNAIHLFDADAKIFLFGSRINDNKKGGDIDILVISSKLNRRKIRQIKEKFYNKFGEQRLDLVIPNNYNKAFVEFILDEAIKL